MPASAEDVPGEVTVNEAFEDSTYEEGLTVSGGSTDAYIYCNEQGRYGTTNCSLAIQSGTYVFEFSEDVYEIGFLVGAVNNPYSVKYYYSDNTDETENKSAQSWGTDGNDMYDDFYKSFTDYNNNEDNTDKFIIKFEVTLTDISVLDTLYWQYVDESTIPTTTVVTLPPTTVVTVPPPPTEEEIAAQKAEEEEQSNDNYEETGFYETNAERKHRENNPDQYEHIYKEQEETAIRDEQREANEELYGCYMTDAQIERGDCDIPEEEDVIPEEEVIIEIEDTKEEVTDAVVDEVFEDVKVPEEPIEEEVVVPTKEEIIEEFEFEEEVIVIDIPEDIVIVIEDELYEETTRRDTEGELPDDDIVVPIVEDEPVKEEIEEEVEVIEDIIVEEISEVVEVIDLEIEEDLSDEEVKEAIEVYVQELPPEEIVEVLEEVNDIGVQNLDQVTEEVQEVIQAVVEEAIEDVEDLTPEQVEVVAEVLQVETEDVEIIAEAVKQDESVATAVEEYVERAVENSDVENYTLADVVTEVQFEEFIDNPIEVLTDINIQDINIATIGNDMTNDQKEKAQEVVVPVILTRIATMAAFVFRRS